MHKHRGLRYRITSYVSSNMSNILFTCTNPKSKSSGGGVLAGLGARRHGVVVGGRALTPVGVLELRVVLRLLLACVHAVLLGNLVAFRARIIAFKRSQALFFHLSLGSGL